MSPHRVHSSTSGGPTIELELASPTNGLLVLANATVKGERTSYFWPEVPADGLETRSQSIVNEIISQAFSYIVLGGDEYE